MLFNGLYGVIVAILLILAGCSKTGGSPNALTSDSSSDLSSCMSAPMPNPAASCADEAASFAASAKLPRLQSTELTSGLYTSVSTEVYVDHPLATGEHLKVGMRESICTAPNSERVYPRMETVCRESNEKSTAPLELKDYGPRLIRIARDERVADVAYRGTVLTTPGGTISYRFEDIASKMGMSRTDFQKNLQSTFDESYFVRSSSMTYLFVGKKKLPTGSTQTIRVTFRKTDGNFAQDALRFDPAPDTLFKI